MEEVTLQQLLEAGCHFGHQAKKWHPKMKPYLFDVREGIHIFDLVKTKAGLEEAAKFLQGLTKSGKTILFVGTKRQAHDPIQKAARETGMPYVTHRWLGGSLTNWDQMQKSLKKLSDMKSAKSRGEYKKFTKREQLLLDREIARLEKLFGGITGLTKMPDAIFVVDSKKESTMVKEANSLKIPVVALADSNCDPDPITVIIPGNDDGTQSVEFIVGYIGQAIKEAQSKAVKPAEEKTSPKSTKPDGSTGSEEKPS